jgi:hypothetical protein
VLKLAKADPENFRAVYEQSTEWECRSGFVYYEGQFKRCEIRALENDLPIKSVVGAFCALSPNNSEKNTYKSLDACIAFRLGRPTRLTVSAYQANFKKAMSILHGEDPLNVLGGSKVVSFYHNTMNPDDSKYVTIDGHMVSVYQGERLRMKRVAGISSKDYDVISNGLRVVAETLEIPAPRLQSILWITWKRMNRILWNPQLDFNFMGGI